MDEKKITLLVIDDSKDDIQLYKRLLRKNERIHAILEAMNVKEGLDIYESTDVDCILLDYKLPGDNGINFIEQVYKSEHPFVPIIMLTGYGNENVAVSAMKAGATDYLNKNDLSEHLLNKTIDHVLDKSKLIAEIHEKTMALERMATTDSLTGLLNRRAFRQAARKFLAKARGGEDALSFLFIDLDNFKGINDQYGHEMGDRLLALASVRLRHCLRKEDIICRFGGDEFVVVIGNISHFDTPSIAQKIIDALSLPYSIEGHTLQISASIGIAYSHENKTVDKLLHSSDRALYDAKRGGKGRYVVSSIKS